MENENKGQMSTGVIVAIVVIIIIILGAFFLLGSESSNEPEVTADVPQEEQTLSEQISEGAGTDNPASNVPQANVFETETNPFNDDGFKNPFE